MTLMIAKLRQLCFGIDRRDLGEYKPLDPFDFELTVIACIGDSTGDSSEIFEFRLCTPTRLGKQCVGGVAVFGRHLLIVESFDVGIIRKKIDGLCVRCSGKTWGDTATRLSRYGAWEFEDYQT